MIRFSLACSNGHQFESWFSSGDSFETLSAAGHVACPDCGDTAITKSLMTPGVATSRKAEAAREEEGALTRPRNEKEAALAALRDKIEAESDYVGLNFAAEARAMHEGSTPSRSIYGEARIDDAKSLIEDGVPVAPLPFTPRSRAN